MSNVEPWEIWELPGGCLLYLHSRFGRLPDEDQQQPPPSMMMPLGKYRGAPIDVVLDDIAYVEWLLRQPWFRERYPTHWRYLADALCRTSDDEGPGAA
jgi:hypothetical protein